MTSPGVGLRVPATPRGRAVWVIPLLLFLAMLLAASLAFNLANLDTGGEQMPGPPNSGTTAANPWGLIDPITAQILLSVAFAGFVAVFILFYLMRQKGTRVKRVLRPSTWSDILATVLALVLLMGVLFLWPQFASRVKDTRAPSNGTTNGAVSNTLPIAPGGIPLGFFLAGAVLASVVALALFLRVGLNLGRPDDSLSLSKRRLAAAEAVQAALAELQLGGDVRTVILACYSRFCFFLGARGLGGQETLTPRELERLAVTGLAVSPDSAESLTSLFEEARYSEHALGEADRDRAVSSLERIRADLGV